MERLGSLYRLYNNIVDGAGANRSGRCLRELETWLRDDVLPEIHTVSARPKFREQARWPLDHLLAGSVSEERTLIDELDELIVNTALKLKRILHTPTFAEKAGTRFMEKRAVEETVVLDGTGT